MRYKVIALCGNYKYKKEILQEQTKLALAGNVVIMPAVFNKADENLNNAERLTAQMLNYQKIEMSDEVYIINKNGYLDESIKLEIQYAAILKKPITYMEKI